MAEYIQLADNSQAMLGKSSGVTRIVQVDASGVVLASGTDYFGGTFGSIYQIPFRKSTKWMHNVAINKVNDDTGAQLGSVNGIENAQLDFEIIGNFEKKIGSIFYSAEKLALSGKNGIYWKVCDYSPVEVPITGNTTQYYYKKRILWMARFEPKFEDARQGDGSPKIWQMTIIPEALAGAAVDVELGQMGQIRKVNAILALSVAETFEAQTEATT